MDSIPDDTQERIGDLIDRGVEEGGRLLEAAEADPVLLGILIAIGVITALVFVWGIVKHAFKAALFGGMLSVATWVWYFNIR